MDDEYKQLAKKMRTKILRRVLSFFLALFLLLETSSAFESRGFISVGLFSFNDSNFRQIYGSFPVIYFSVDVFPWENFALSAGVNYLFRKGEAAVISGDPEQFPVSFARLTIPLLVKFRLLKNRFQASVGLGLAYSSYRENWSDIELSYQGQSVHFRYELSAGYNLSKRIFFQVTLAGESIPTGVSSPLLNGARANLAGMSILVGFGL
jgi:hypothetical protein